jgi:L-alanine-DL-glutamate epimerase-like enolase superfamily enzyme
MVTAQGTGRGEATPFLRYGETVATTLELIEKVRPEIEQGLGRIALQDALPPGAARTALDGALWDLEAKRSGRRVWELAGLPAPRPVPCAVTIGIDTPEKMHRAAKAVADAPLIKLKIDTFGGLERVQAVHEGAPGARLIVDGNEGVRPSEVGRLCQAFAGLNVALFEQPLHANQDAILARFDHAVPVGADESCHVREDPARLADRYDVIIIKPGKAGGLTEGLEVKAAARAAGLKVMVVCMFGSSLGVAPSVLLAQDADFANIEVTRYLARDREPGLGLDGYAVLPPAPELWG